MPVFHPQGMLDGWQGVATQKEKVEYLHRAVRESYPEIERIAIATYDSGCDMLKTFLDSTIGVSPLAHYQVELSRVHSLVHLKNERRSRLINDLKILDESIAHHSRRLRHHGFHSSYTVPMYIESRFLGFIFFNSRQKNAFNDSNLSYLEMIAQLLSMMVGAELQQVETLRGALKTATYFSHHRDPETGDHLERMARFSRLIAKALATTHGYSDEFVEDIFWFSPLHDIGKIAVPDEILLKPGKLNAREFERMQLHTIKGKEIIHNMLSNFSIRKEGAIEMMSNIAMYHHEAMDGSGYPQGLIGTEIPIEARIVAVADVFDALTSQRPYKPAWSNEEAFAELERLAGKRLDPECVDALCRHHEEVAQIQRIFRDTYSYLEA